MFDFFGNHTRKILEFCDNIDSKIYKKIGDLSIEGYLSKEPLGYSERTTGDKKSLGIGDKWGDVFDCAWFHFTGTVPAEGKGKHVVLLIDVSGELCVVDENGVPTRGLTNGSSTYDYQHGMPGKKVLQLSNGIKEGDRIDFWADGGCNDLFGVLCKDGRIVQAEIAICNDNIRSLYYDYWTLCELSKVLDKESARYAKVMHALNLAMKSLQTYSDQEVEKARDILAVELSRKNADPCMTISAIGHAHLDLAWLWPIRETIRKGARTFATAIELMDRYPDYKFGVSQPQLFQWMKDLYPELYVKIKEKVAEGRIEVQGGMWVEADANITSGESFVRQFLYGKRFFEKEFGIEVNSLWLPDVFGYSAALPQILKTCGIDYFMTQKLSWNDTNKFPNHTFYWKGMDGTGVLTHMLPEETYNSHAGPRSASKSEKNYAQKAISDRCLMLFGIGDGGGGPGAEHLERLDRLKNLNGVPPIEQEFSSEFFKRIDKEGIEYPQWKGELYLEKHRGTYTTQAKNKKYNRMMEFALRNLEFISYLTNGNGFDYPQEKLEKIWKEVLLYQFHDILPGSSIKRVYDESVERYEAMLNEVSALIDDALDSACKNIDSAEKKNPAAVFNTLSWKRDQWINTSGKWIKATVEPMGYAVVDTDQQAEIPTELKAETQLLQNDKLTVKFDADGAIISITDKVSGINYIQKGSKANALKVYIDKGDAWDFPNDYREIPAEKFILESTTSRIDGPQAIIEQTYKYNKSTLSQKIILTAGSSRIDFVTDVDWNETFRMLRSEFPVNVFSDYATCDIQYGNINRPTHTNTSWDNAKLEICAHKFVDISQTNYGVAMLNDSKYGFRVVDNILDINLLRSPEYPGESADKGKHSFVYSLYPHEGNHIVAKVAQEAYNLNCPLLVRELEAASGTMPQANSFMSVDNDAVVIETVKKAEDSCDMIVRMYENYGTNCCVNLETSLPFDKAYITDSMEKELTELKVSDGKINLEFRPWEIKTVKLNIKK